MKKYYIVFTLLLALFLLPLPSSSKSDGAYNIISRMIWCETELSCYHEVAHKIDQENGWVSRSDEFVSSVRVYLLWQAKKDGTPSPLYDYIVFTPNMSYTEIYARIFEYFRGDSEAMPEQFRHFYDFDRAEELMNELR